jgi:hypothetical protein
VSGKITIVVNDREDSTTIEVDERYWGTVELDFRDGVMTQGREVRRRSKQVIRGEANPTNGTQRTDMT